MKRPERFNKEAYPIELFDCIEDTCKVSKESLLLREVARDKWQDTILLLPVFE